MKFHIETIAGLSNHLNDPHRLFVVDISTTIKVLGREFKLTATRL